MDLGLQDRVAVVTGGTSGIGLATARVLLAEGAAVAICGRDGARLAAARSSLLGNVAEKRLLAVPCDVLNKEAVGRFAAAVEQWAGRCDILVNNAGVTRFAGIMDLTEADWDRIHRVNAKGVFFCLQRAARQMIRQFETDGSGGRIINMASISGRGYPGASNAAYAASKGAVIALTKMAAQQLGRYNINVNAICPGITRTELSARNAEGRAKARGITVEELYAEQERGIPIGRANTPDDIAAMALFLASPGARNITGQAYNVDGGLVPS
jgi:NAD(P)-dependent dehydrogenase (short-subunit alcohol dehydrogenase family)